MRFLAIDQRQNRQNYIQLLPFSVIFIIDRIASN